MKETAKKELKKDIDKYMPYKAKKFLYYGILIIAFNLTTNFIIYGLGHNLSDILFYLPFILGIILSLLISFIWYTDYQDNQKITAFSGFYKCGNSCDVYSKNKNDLCPNCNKKLVPELYVTTRKEAKEKGYKIKKRYTPSQQGHWSL